MNSENDGDDAASSRYSSCGESEYDRYCSANSAMGTPSVCSSVTVFNDFPELDFGGSSRSLGLGFGGEGGGLESFSLGGEKVERSSEGTKRLSDETTTAASSANYGSSGFELYGNESDEISFSGFDGNNGLMAWNKVEKSESLPSKGLSEFNHGGSENGDCSEDGNGDDDDEEVLGKCRDFERISGRGVESLNPSYVGEERDLDGEVKEMEGLEDEASSRGEHSESEDSMYNHGSDEDEDKDKRVETGGCFRNEGYRIEVKTRDENPLLINSSVAFGSEDWDDFELESGGLAMPLDSLTMGGFEKRKVSDSIHVNSGKQEASIPVLRNQVEVFDELDDIVNKSEAEDVKDIPIASFQVRGGSDAIEFTKSSISTPVTAMVEDLEKEDISQIPYTKSYVRGGNGSVVDCPRTNSLDNVCDGELGSLAEEFPEKISFEKRNDGVLQGNQNMQTRETVNVDDSQDSSKPNIKLNHFDDSPADPASSSSTASSRNTKYLLKDSDDHGGEHSMPVKTEARELNEFYDEVVLEMEEILLASNESPGARFPCSSNRALQSQLSLPVRDGGSSASTSGTDNAYPFVHRPFRIDMVEVVGARQKKGDVSLGERLVGVKEYTLYTIRVWSGDDKWEIERRYRDFSALYSRLKTSFASQGCALPSPWPTVEKESRKIFGNASPDVVAERSVLIQECLHSILHPRFFATSSSALTWFLCPRDSNTAVSRSVNIGNRGNISTLGKTISLIVEIQPYKSMKQMLESQHYTCVGCYKHFDDGKTLIRDFAQTFGWGKPRLCEYTSQLFCSSCHTNETAVLPARVLHNWDFAQYPVSQLAKSYLDSIHDQPMLCVSAVNPFLFSKVPTLLHVMGVRRKIGSILAHVRCSFRGSINKGLGSRRYLLESNDFFALRDLIDLSKGAFAVLPVMVETVLKRITEHITEQCLVCCDVGVPCGARQACDDPSSLIFPFQQANIEKCSSCESEFHKACLKKLTECHCGARLGVDNNTKLAKRLSRGAGGESNGALDFLGKGLGLGSGSGLSVGFLSGLFTKVNPERNFGEHRNSDNVILMGSLPSTSL